MSKTSRHSTPVISVYGIDALSPIPPESSSAVPVSCTLTPETVSYTHLERLYSSYYGEVSNHAALFGVIADFSIVAAVKTLPGSVGCAGNGALTGAALYLCD